MLLQYQVVNSAIILLILNNSGFLKMSQWPASGRQLHPPETQAFRESSAIFDFSCQDWVLWNETSNYFTFEKSAVLLVSEEGSPLILLLHNPYWWNTTYWCAQATETGGTERLFPPLCVQSAGTMQMEHVHKPTGNQTWPNMAWNYLCTLG